MFGIFKKKEKKHCSRCDHCCVEVLKSGLCEGCERVLSYEAAGSPSHDASGKLRLPPGDPYVMDHYGSSYEDRHCRKHLRERLKNERWWE